MPYMQRTTVYVSELQNRQLTEVAKRDGLKVAEIIRRAIDDYLNNDSEKRIESLERRVKALEEWQKKM